MTSTASADWSPMTSAPGFGRALPSADWSFLFIFLHLVTFSATPQPGPTLFLKCWPIGFGKCLQESVRLIRRVLVALPTFVVMVEAFDGRAI